MTEKEEQLYNDRLKKLEALRKAGIDPYPAKSERTHTVAEVLERFASLAKQKKKITLTGRIRALRKHGGIVFANIEDGRGLMQFMLREEDLGAKKFAEFAECFDIGDFIQVTGILTETKRGEKTVLLSDFKILAKSLRTLPEQWHGLTDIEIRLRKRYLDMIANAEVREMFVKKARFWKAMREYLEGEGFIEFETPALEDVAGGADATPFITHHNALDRDFYLRISLELPLKKIIVGGFEKVYEIGKVFRNEGISTEHLQDYLLCEIYWAYADYQDMMEITEGLFKYVIKETTGGLDTVYDKKKINWSKKWQHYDYFELVEKEGGIDLSKVSLSDLARIATKMGIKIEKGWGKGRIIDNIFKKKVRPNLIQPGFLINHPVEVSPLAKKHPNLPGRVERFQIIAGGTELGNGYSELNDPLDQKKRFEEQAKLREAGDEEAQMMDESFIEALEYGMPPTAGFGVSSRLFTVLMDKTARETTIFPPMREK